MHDSEGSGSEPSDSLDDEAGAVGFDNEGKEVEFDGFNEIFPVINGANATGSAFTAAAKCAEDSGLDVTLDTIFCKLLSWVEEFGERIGVFITGEPIGVDIFGVTAPGISGRTPVEIIGVGIGTRAGATVGIEEVGAATGETGNLIQLFPESIVPAGHGPRQNLPLRPIAVPGIGHLPFTSGVDGAALYTLKFERCSTPCVIVNKRAMINRTPIVRLLYNVTYVSNARSPTDIYTFPSAELIIAGGECEKNTV